MIDEADLFAIHPAGVQQRAAVRATAAHQVQLATGAAIERQLFAHDLQRNGGAHFHALAQRDGLPELPQQAAHVGIGAHFGEAVELCCARKAAFVELTHLFVSSVGKENVRPARPADRSAGLGVRRTWSIR
ncbi:hypothetical protein SDC9_192053 [bioreactor metagenome]|uniref:Uncharacterized protein n=1 Tax=bioreactor metagenome TaxID=1076179 RepID=A0A645HZQ9_9ZZZZ